MIFFGGAFVKILGEIPDFRDFPSYFDGESSSLFPFLILSSATVISVSRSSYILIVSLVFFSLIYVTN